MVSPIQNTGQGVAQAQMAGGREPANLADILERVLDRGLVIAGDIRVSLLDIELLTIKLRLLIASVDTARELGIDWWEHDPWLSSRAARERAESRARTELTSRRSDDEANALPRPSGRATDYVADETDPDYE
jgi:gas vesicle protein GvpA/GvpJ/GvpM family